MSQKGKHAETPYLQLMRECVRQLIGEGYDAFNQDQLAALMGKRKTDSFRNRLQQLIDEGVLVSWSYCTDRGGVGTAYASAKLQQLPLPEESF